MLAIKLAPFGKGMSNLEILIIFLNCLLGKKYVYIAEEIHQLQNHSLYIPSDIEFIAYIALYCM